MSESIGWPLPGFVKVWKEIEDAKMGFADWESKLIWVPKAMKYNPPESPNVAAFWRECFEEMPECSLKAKAKVEIEGYLLELGDAFHLSWEAGSRRLARTIYRISRKIPLEIAYFVRKRDGDKCQHCGKKVNWSDRRGPDGATYDHLDPTLGHTIGNLVVSCRSCSSKRGNTGKTIQENQSIDSGRDLGSDSGMDLGSVPDYPDNHSSSSKQEQEQEQEQKKDLKPLSGRKKQTTPNPRVKEFIDFYFRAFRTRFGMDPIIDGGKDGMLIKSLLSKITLDELKELAEDFLESDDEFIQKSGYTIGVFKSQIQKLRVKPPLGGKTFAAARIWLRKEEARDEEAGQKEIPYGDSQNQGESSGD
jgi:hypothetical protein